MIQIIAVVLLFLIASYYLGRKLYREYAGKSNGHCDHCAINEMNQLSQSTIPKLSNRKATD